MKAVLVATIGTRDLMFQVSSSSWYNIGDDRMQDGDIIGEQAEVISDLGLGAISYRDLTHHLFQQDDTYIERIKPVIIGKLLTEQAAHLEKVYLVGTNQNPEIRERGKDTLYACELIQRWLAHYYPDIAVEIIHLGTDGTNPSNFEAMFRWWRQAWRKAITVQPEQPLWVCLKGGVGQATEASRISGLSLYGDRISFFEFQQNPKANRTGIPSDYTGPFQGTSYLWDRTQQQAQKLLERYDYAGVSDLLHPYFQQDSAGFAAAPNLVKAGSAWNQGNFETFFALAKSTLDTTPRKQGKNWWWMAYEQAYLAVVRLEQQNTAEAMLHSFRSIEGLLWKWVKENNFPMTEEPGKYPQLQEGIVTSYPVLSACFLDKNGQPVAQTALTGWVQQRLLEAVIPRTTASPDFQAFWGKETREKRNFLSHKLGGLTEKEVFQAWGNDIKTSEQWQRRILNCLNLVTGQSFKSLSQASLFTKIHSKVNEAIANYEILH